uniref:Uncharacterized protein n=1 Tax=Glossina pallidipes TaxID=7398 RepID=A0A1B0A998_GLOPL
MLRLPMRAEGAGALASGSVAAGMGLETTLISLIQQQNPTATTSPPPSLNRRIGDARTLTKRIRFNAQTYGISTQQFLWPFVFQYKGVHTYKRVYNTHLQWQQ